MALHMWTCEGETATTSGSLSANNLNNCAADMFPDWVVTTANSTPIHLDLREALRHPPFAAFAFHQNARRS